MKQIITLEQLIQMKGEIPICGCPICKENGTKVNVKPDKNGSYSCYIKYKYPKYINGHWARTEEAKCKNLGKNGFKEGQVAWNKGLTKENDPRVKKISEKLTGKHLSEEHINSLINNHYDNSGENNPNWNGGTSFGKYCPKFNNEKKEEIRNKYKRCCILCNKPESQNLTKSGKHWKLHVHHIDYNKLQGCEDHEWRLVPLCLSCHMKTNNGDRKEWELKIKNTINKGE